jgi:hypothetical protein
LEDKKVFSSIYILQYYSLVPCNENRYFPVWKTSQGKPCSGPILALYRIAVYLLMKKTLTANIFESGPMPTP